MTGSPGTLRLCGDWGATTGLAHAARRLALALLHCGIDLTVSEVHSGAPRQPWLYPDELRALPPAEPRPLTVWMLNINELHQVPDEELWAWPARYNIATWYWELPIVPAWMQPQFDRVSEIWAPTRFVQRSMIRYTDRPVHVVPPVVPVFSAEGDDAWRRRQLGLPQDRTLFLASFDFNSSVSRKNPMAVVEAFAQAFPTSTSTRPLLVMKAINLPPGAPFTTRLRQAVEHVDGLLIDRNMSHHELGNLFHTCDVYVSLHRSEGFGLGLAESMAIGKPVIGTAYSGNLDFMSLDNSCLVGYRLREIEASDQVDNPGIEGTYIQGALWAEPDVEQAAQWMRVLHGDAELRNHIGSAGMSRITSGFSESAIGRLAIDRLASVRGELETGQQCGTGLVSR